MRQSPERSYRIESLLIVLKCMFLNEDTSEKCFGFCRRGIKKPAFYGCGSWRQYFSVESEMIPEESMVPLRVWVKAVLLGTTNLKVVSPMKRPRDLTVCQPTAWFMLHQIREFPPISLEMLPNRGGQDLCRRSGEERARGQEATVETRNERGKTEISIRMALQCTRR